MSAAGKGGSRVHGVLLAAGQSERFGTANKLLAEVDGMTLVRHAADALCESRADGVTVVTGYDEAGLRSALAGLDVAFSHNPDFASGLASSLKCAIRNAPGEADAAMVVLADMPGISSELINSLIDVFDREREKIVFPVNEEGAQGNPVIWPRRFFPDLLELEGDRGAKPLIAKHAAETRAMNVRDSAAFNDVDAPADLARLKGDDGS